MTEPTAKKLKKVALQASDSFWINDSVSYSNFLEDVAVAAPSAPAPEKKKEESSVLYCAFIWRKIDDLGETSEFKKYSTELELEKYIKSAVSAYKENSDYLEWRITTFAMIMDQGKPAVHLTWNPAYLVDNPEHFYYKRNKTPKQYVNGPKANYANSSKHF